MDIVEALRTEIIMDGQSRFGTDAEGRTVLVGTGAQVGDGAEELVGMALLNTAEKVLLRGLR